MRTPELSAVDGLRLRLRLVVLEDAAYIHGLRSDPAYNVFLSEYSGTVETQAAWLSRYKEREAAGREYYYIIERKPDHQPCGVVRLYDITEETFTWGSWILDHNKPAKAALESALLSFSLGFDTLALSTALVDVRNNNDKARAIYERLGMRYLRHDTQDTYFEYTSDQYHTDLARHWSIIRAG